MKYSRSYLLCIFFLINSTFGTKTVTLEVIQPSTGPVCPGQDVILTCTVVQTGAVIETILNWRHGSSSVRYDSAIQQPGPLTLDSLITTAVFMTSTNSTIITSNATLTSGTLSNNNTIISCFSPPQDNSQTATIIVAGSDGMPFGLQITASASLTWLPPNTNCTFNYTVNITNSSCSMTVYSNSTSLILIDELIGSAYDSSWAERVVQLTREQNYSFAVAVTDSTGQHGPWSDQLRVMWDVPGSVFNISWRLNQTIIVVDWNPPSSLTHLPVLYYTVTHNVSGSELAFNTTTNTSYEAILNAGSQHYGETYFLSVCAVNAVGKGPSEMVFINVTTSIVTSSHSSTKVMSSTASMTLLPSGTISAVSIPTITIASSIGGFIIIVLIAVFLLILIFSKGRCCLRHKSIRSSPMELKELVLGNTLYSTTLSSNYIQTSIGAKESVQNTGIDAFTDQGQLYEQPCCVQNQRSSPKNLVYAQVGKRPPNAPIVPPSIDKVVYATIHSINS